MKRLRTGGVVAYDLAGAVQTVFVCDEPVQTDGTAGVEFSGRDSDLGTEPVAEPVGKAGRAVAVDARGVHKGHEPLAGGIVLRDDAVRVMRAIAVDVGRGFLDRVNQLYGEDQIQISL